MFCNVTPFGSVERLELSSGGPPVVSSTEALIGGIGGPAGRLQIDSAGVWHPEPIDTLRTAAPPAPAGIQDVCEFCDAALVLIFIALLIALVKR